MRRRIEIEPPTTPAPSDVNPVHVAEPTPAPSVRVAGAELAGLVALEDALIAWRWGVPGESTGKHEVALIRAIDAYVTARGIPLPAHALGSRS